MKKINQIGLIILIVYSITISILYFSSNKDIKFDPVYIPNDTVYTINTIPVNKPYKVIVPLIDTIKIVVTDSNCLDEYKKLLVQYLTKKYYNDTVQNDSSMTIIVKQILSCNKSDSLTVLSKNNRSTIIQPVNKEISKFGIGLQGGYKSLTPYVSYAIKDNTSIYTGYDVISKSMQIGIRYNFYKK